MTSLGPSNGVHHASWLSTGIRLEPGVIGAFPKVWDTDELLVSSDAVNMSLPYVVDQLPADISVLSPQVDERPRKPRKYCVQGFINLVNLTIY
ncbi:hypothetical protein I312_106580 [Cryptococcus bacillisporus CA1280]|uniref:uncharacterized protein n=1 Tax=Cryptococcus bacillisporus CA1280 TaxID=1296109 RepID=UPI00336861C6